MDVCGLHFRTYFFKMLHPIYVFVHKMSGLAQVVIFMVECFSKKLWFSVWACKSCVGFKFLIAHIASTEMLKSVGPAGKTDENQSGPTRGRFAPVQMTGAVWTGL